ncbi:hypothetical protein AB3662_06780 [Sorangium cellulosum]|uniref:hypothetical protein n=1 Tax=Sorangium cellulosum TaxID=56 RepID=UPI003D9A3199
MSAISPSGPDDPPPYADTGLLEACGLRVTTFFPVPALRRALAAGLADHVPASFASLPMLLRRGFIQADVALLQVSQPDEHGRCSLGPSAALVPALLESGIPIIAEMNRRAI